MSTAAPPYVFKPRARLLLLLGDELIRDAGIAVFELVKNAYDADASEVSVSMQDVGNPLKGKITILDDGSGMDLKTIETVWLEPGTDFRRKQREKAQLTPEFHRTPLGEKGIGRFASHKLGKKVLITTRKARSREVIVEFDWTQFEKNQYLSEVPVKIWERDPAIFKGSKTGTKIEIEQLRDTWNRGMARDLARAITSITSPFSGNKDFHPQLNFTNSLEQKWLEGLLSAEQVREFALFHTEGTIEGTTFTYTYEFTPFKLMEKRVKGRKVSLKVEGMQIEEDRVKRSLDLSKFNIGPVTINLDIFDLDPQTLQLGVTDKRGLKEFLTVSGGIRVYRDQMRVYDYGEPGNDWLDLGARRVNIPSRRISNNQVIGAVSVDLSKSSDLIEKTNREGFVDNPAFREFRDAVIVTLTHVETERNKDKARIREQFTDPRASEPVLGEIGELRTLAEKKHWDEVLPYLKRIERDYVTVRDQFLTSASAGLSLTVVIHEVEKGIRELLRTAVDEGASDHVVNLARHLSELVESLASLSRQSGKSKESGKDLIELALFASRLRLKAHKIDVVTDFDKEFQVKCSRRLVVASLVNLIDNSIYWLDNKYGEDAPAGKKRIYLGLSDDLAGAKSIVVADNGPGFVDPPEYLVQPFISRKPEGMGLGLHLADQVMRAQGGSLVFPQQGDVTLPRGFTGAVVAMAFGGTK